MEGTSVRRASRTCTTSLASLSSTRWPSSSASTSSSKAVRPSKPRFLRPLRTRPPKHRRQLGSKRIRDRTLPQRLLKQSPRRRQRRRRSRCGSSSGKRTSRPGRAEKLPMRRLRARQPGAIQGRRPRRGTPSTTRLTSIACSRRSSGRGCQSSLDS